MLPLWRNKFSTDHNEEAKYSWNESNFEQYVIKLSASFNIFNWFENK